MPTYPIGPGAHIDVPLSNFASKAFADPRVGHVADQVFPEIRVAKQSDKYYIIEPEAFWRVPDTSRAPKTRAHRVNFQVSSESYFAQNYALATDNSLEDLANADMAMSLRENGTMLVVGGLRLDQERRVANICTSISNCGSGVALTGVNRWSDYGGSDPIADVNTGHAFIRSQTGLIANTAVIDWDTLQIVRRHPVLLDMYKYTSGGELNDAELRSVFKIDQMLVAQGTYDSSLEGATANRTNIWGNTFFLVHVGPNTGLRSQVFGARFRWRPGGMPSDFGVLTSVNNRAGEEHVEVLEAGYFQDEKVIARNLSYAITDTL